MGVTSLSGFRVSGLLLSVSSCFPRVNGPSVSQYHCHGSAAEVKDMWHAGSAEGVQAAVWVRLKLLLPLLPLVYADPEPDSTKNMRAALAKALLPIMASPLVYQHARCASWLPSGMQCC